MEEEPLWNEDQSQKNNGGSNSACGHTHILRGQSLALRTLPVIVSNGNKHVMVNAFLDDGST